MKPHLLLTLAISLAPLAAQAAPQATPVPGFACSTLAPRQAMPGAPNVTFRVLKQTYSHGMKAVPHSHKFGEILYLLNGTGTNTMNGKTTALSSDEALVIAPNTEHYLLPTGSGDLTMLDVQFTDKSAPGWHPTAYRGPSACSDARKAGK